MPEILQPNADTIAQCVAQLKRGIPMAFPTETVYGLACDSTSEPAVCEVFRLKQRPANNPLIAHVLDAAMAKATVIGWDVRAQRLADAFWPGPLAIILPRRAHVCAASVGGRSNVAVRSPAHPVARALIEAFGGPISAPSANRSGRVSPTTALHVAEEFSDADELLILDGGPCEVGLESTVLDLSRARPMILRPGAVTVTDLEAILGPIAMPDIGRQSSSPGTSPSHYAPKTPTELVPDIDLATRLASEPQRVAVVAFVGTPVIEGHELFALPHHPAAYAQMLYATLRRADASGAAKIFIVAPTERGGIWDAAHDRLRRAVARRS